MPTGTDHIVGFHLHESLQRVLAELPEQIRVCVPFNELQQCDPVFCHRVSLLRCVVVVIHSLPETAVACFNLRSELHPYRGHYQEAGPDPALFDT